ncbi:cache domain-containing sensor histidine kinase [Mitsuokella jalaludinii]|uniref:cache domain-containing sensor histidine kinase n=1 Tax=Mitsuokella jalaludinii TaxID=187979 RepID=UPI003F9E8B05
MIRKWKMSYRLRLLSYIFLAGFLPVLVLSVGVLLIVYQNIDRTEAQEAYQNVHSVAEQVSTSVDGYVKMVDALSESVVIEHVLDQSSDDVREAYGQMFLLMRGNHEQAALHVLSADGHVVLSTSDIPHIYHLPENNGWGIFARAAQSKEAVLVSAPRQDPDFRNIVLTLCRAVRKDQQIIGYVIVDVERRAIWDILNKYASRSLILTDRHHYVFYNTWGSSREGVISGITGSGKFSADSGIVRDSQNPDKKIYYFHEPKYHIAVMQQEVTNRSGFYELRRIVAIFDLIVLVIIVLLSYKLTRDLWEPMGDLVAGMECVRQNNLAVRIPIRRKDEIGALAATFNKMVHHIRRLLREAKQKEETLRIAQIKGLQEQVKPHFIYNTLDLIKWSAKAGDTKTVALLAVSLGRLLRKILGKSAFITVREEFEILQAYMTIQEKRFGDRIQVKFFLDSALAEKYLPKLILEPVLENAVKHGLGSVTEKGEIRVSSHLQGKYMVFEIADNGVGMDPAKVRQYLEGHDDQHVGLYNVHLRAKLNGDAACGVAIKPRPQGGTRVIIRLLVLEEVPQN